MYSHLLVQLDRWRTVRTVFFSVDDFLFGYNKLAIALSATLSAGDFVLVLSPVTAGILIRYWCK